MPIVANTIRRRARVAIRDAIRALAMEGFKSESIVSRKTPLSTGLDAPAIVVAGPEVRRRPSPAGLRVRQLVYTATVYVMNDGSGEPNQDDQDDILETIEAAFDLPPTMPAGITAAVPEAQELRVDRTQQFLQEARRYHVDKHSLAISLEVWQVAGVAT